MKTLPPYFQYGLWSCQTVCVNLERFLPKNQHTKRKFLNFENWPQYFFWIFIWKSKFSIGVVQIVVECPAI